MEMKRILGVAAVLLFAALIHPAYASTPGHRSGAPARTVAMTFRIVVSGRPARWTTFWVAYGPLDEHFGILRLRQTGQKVYETSVKLPTDGHTDFAYLVGNGAIKTRLGLEPGDPVTTIRIFHHVTPGQESLPPVLWQPPIG
jgi:hypothetical protein